MNKRAKINNHIFIGLIIVLLFFSVSGNILAQCEIGKPAPDFVLQDLDGGEFQLSQLKNQQDFILISFVEGDHSNSITKLEETIAFFRECSPKESYRMITVVVPQDLDSKNLKDRLKFLQEKTDIPLTVLIAENSEILESYQIEGYPTFILLRDDLCVRKVYSKFTIREERVFYQYLNFVLTCQKESNSSECDNGVCPPPPGYE